MDASVDPRAALRHLNKAKAIDPTFLAVYKQSGYVHKSMNNCRKALKSFRVFVKRSKPGPDRDEVLQEIETLDPVCR